MGRVGTYFNKRLIVDTTMEETIRNKPVITETTFKESGECTNVILPYEKSEEIYVESLGELRKKPVYSFLKRTFDIVVSFVCMLILAIPMLIVAGCVVCTSKGGVFYFQERLGKDGKPFTLIKFRTMYTDAEAGGIRWCITENDERITKVGKVLRKYHIDELPQLWCIFVGDMSFVGPRPERECYYKEFEKYIHGFSERLKVVPGLTGIAQIHDDFLMRPELKIMYDVKYIKTRSLWNDFKILFKTATFLMKKDRLIEGYREK